MHFNKPKIVDFGSIGTAELGYLSVASRQKSVPFEIKRVYWTYYTPHHIVRGHHAHLDLEQIIVAVSGQLHITTEGVDGDKQEFQLLSPDLGLYIPKMYWRTLRFSHNAVLLSLASQEYSESDYIRSYEDFKKISQEQ